MPEPQRRKRFQIHLSTAVVMMFVAGGILWANLRSAPLSIYGWPFYEVWWDSETIGHRTFPVDNGPYFTRMILSNLAVALGIIFAVWFLCECLIRRSARK